MPLTPSFTIDQTDDTVTVCVTVPSLRLCSCVYGRASQAADAPDDHECTFELHLDDADFALWCKPYLLKLRFPGAVCDDERVRVCVDADGDAFGRALLRVTMHKAEPGTHWERLDLITTLMQPSRSRVQPGADIAEAQQPEHTHAHTHTHAHSHATGEDHDAAVARLAREVDGLYLRDGRSARAPLIEVIDSTEAASDARTHTHTHTHTDAASDDDVTEGERPASPLIEEHATSVRLDDGVAAAPEPLPPLIRGRDTGFGVCRHIHTHTHAYARALADGDADTAEAVQLPQPDRTPADERPRLRMAAERAAYSFARACADAFAHTHTGGQTGDDAEAGADDEGGPDPLLMDALRCSPWWMSPPGASPSESDALSQSSSLLAALPNKEFLLDGVAYGAGAMGRKLLPKPSGEDPASCAWWATHEETLRALLVCVSVCAAFAYDHRFTAGEPSVESAWTVATLAAPLSWLDDCFVEDAEGAGWPCVLGCPAAPSRVCVCARVCACVAAHVRRVLTYPYMRRWDVGVLTAMDAATILLRGVRSLVRALLQVRALLASDPIHFIHERIWLSDLLVLVQHMDEDTVRAAGSLVHTCARTLTPAHPAFADMDLSFLNPATGQPELDRVQDE